MDLFTILPDATRNILPKDGEVFYFGPIMSAPKANQFLENLRQSIEWKNDEAIIFGKHIITKRKAAWYGDKPFEYTYSKITKRALPWTPTLLSLKALVEQETNESYNSCLLNLYHDGNEGMAWHSDDERDLKKNGAIASLSFGAVRKFTFKHKESKETVSIQLENGSLLLMNGVTQSFWWHRLATSKLVHQARVNLTFRTIIS